MNKLLKTLILTAAFGTLLQAGQAVADDDSFAPGGTAVDRHTERFQDLKIVMDLKAKDVDAIKYGTMVASRIIDHPGTKLVVVIEGPMVSMFAKKNYLDHQGIIDQWVGYAEKGVQVEYCGNSVNSVHLKPEDMEALSDKNKAVVNSGAFPSIAHYESQGYALVVPMAMPLPEKK
jgi:intracellular sulfur oxidation DsrE/DsrF family protein